jgi:hypothetical protein
MSGKGKFLNDIARWYRSMLTWPNRLPKSLTTKKKIASPNN